MNISKIKAQYQQINMSLKILNDLYIRSVSEYAFKKDMDKFVVILKKIQERAKKTGALAEDVQVELDNI